MFASPREGGGGGAHGGIVLPANFHRGKTRERRSLSNRWHFSAGGNRTKRGVRGGVLLLGAYTWAQFFWAIALLLFAYC